MVLRLLGKMFEDLPEAAPRLTGRQRVAAWWTACRPPFFIVDVIPITLALALVVRETGQCPWFLYVVVLLGCFMVHTVANIANDLFDHILGVDGGDNIGGSRVIQRGFISPRQITLTMTFLLAVSVGLGYWLMRQSGQFWLLWPLVFAAFSAVFYVAPPIRYGHRGYGELFVGLNMGFIMVSGAYAVMAGSFCPASLALGLPVGLMVAGILFYQSLPEIETDEEAGKYTLAVHLGKQCAVLVFYLWWPLVWVLMLNVWACGLAGWPVFLGLVTVPLYVRACILVRRAVRNADWLGLDAHGHLVRKLYLLNGVALIAAVWVR